MRFTTYKRRVCYEFCAKLSNDALCATRVSPFFPYGTQSVLDLLTSPPAPGSPTVSPSPPIHDSPRPSPRPAPASPGSPIDRLPIDSSRPAPASPGSPSIGSRSRARLQRLRVSVSPDRPARTAPARSARFAFNRPGSGSTGAPLCPAPASSRSAPRSVARLVMMSERVPARPACPACARLQIDRSRVRPACVQSPGEMSARRARLRLQRLQIDRANEKSRGLASPAPRFSDCQAWR